MSPSVQRVNQGWKGLVSMDWASGVMAKRAHFRHWEFANWFLLMLNGSNGAEPWPPQGGFPAPSSETALPRGQLVLAFPSQLSTWSHFPARMPIRCRGGSGLLGLDGGVTRQQREVAALTHFIGYQEVFWGGLASRP